MEGQTAGAVNQPTAAEVASANANGAMAASHATANPGQRVQHLDKSVTFSTLGSALAQFEAHRNGAGEVHLFVENEVVPGSADGSVPATVTQVVTYQPADKDKKIAEAQVLDPRVLSAIPTVGGKPSLIVKVMAVTTEGAHLAFAQVGTPVKPGSVFQKVESAALKLLHEAEKLVG